MRLGRHVRRTWKTVTGDPRLLVIATSTCILVGLCILIQFGLPIAAWLWRGGELRLLSPNELGDSFGLMNAVLSAFALAALLFTLIMQSRELDSAQSALESNRRQNLLTAYLTAVSTAVNHYNSRPDNEPGYGDQDDHVEALSEGRLSSKRGRKQADYLTSQLESLMELMIPDVKRAVPLGRLSIIEQELHAAVDRILKDYERREASSRHTIRHAELVTSRFGRLLEWVHDSHAMANLRDTVTGLENALDDLDTQTIQVDLMNARLAEMNTASVEHFKIAQNMQRGDEQSREDAQRHVECQYRTFCDALTEWRKELASHTQSPA